MLPVGNCAQTSRKKQVRHFRAIKNLRRKSAEVHHKFVGAVREPPFLDLNTKQLPWHACKLHRELQKAWGERER